MIIKIKKRDDPYARVANSVLCDKRLSYRARGVLAYLLSKPSDWEVMASDVVNNGTEGREAIRACFRELKEHGYAKLMAGRGKGRWWIICEDPNMESPETAISKSGLESPETQITQKPAATKKREEVQKKDGGVLQIQADRIAAIFKRRKTTPWSEKEVKAWKQLTKPGPLDDDELTMVERFYAANRKRPEAFCRTAVLTLLRYWTGEVDKARPWCEKHPVRSKAVRFTQPSPVDNRTPEQIEEDRRKGKEMVAGLREKLRQPEHLRNGSAQ